MHEMAIAEGILDIALKAMEENEAKRVARVKLLVGEMAGVECESLLFCFEALTKGTAADGAALDIERVPLTGRCHDCGREMHIRPQDLLCPLCGGGLEMTGGREMRVDYIEME